MVSAVVKALILGTDRTHLFLNENLAVHISLSFPVKQLASFSQLEQALLTSVFDCESREPRNALARMLSFRCSGAIGETRASLGGAVSWTRSHWPLLPAVAVLPFFGNASRGNRGNLRQG